MTNQEFKKTVLIIDDDIDFAESLGDILDIHGYEFSIAQNSNSLLEAISLKNPQLALIDIRLGKENGIDLIAKIKQINPQILCVMMTAYAHIDTAVKALQSGAYDYLRKPISGEELISTLNRCYEKLSLEYENKEAHSRLAKSEEKYRCLVDTMNEGVVVLNGHCSISYVNDRFCEIVGYTPNELYGMDVTLLMDESTRYNICDCSIAEERKKFEIVWNRKDGKQKTTIVAPQNISQPDSNESLCFAVITDITQRKYSEEALRIQKREADIRVKELNCLFAISSMCDKVNMTLDEILRRTIAVIPQSLQYPEIVCAKISVFEKDYCRNFCRSSDYCSELQAKGTLAHLSKKIVSSGTEVGSIRVWFKDNAVHETIEPFLKEEHSLLTAVAELLGTIIERTNTEEKLKKSVEKLQTAMDGIVQAMAMTAEIRDPYTAGHQRRVSRLATSIAQEMGLPENEIDGIRLAGLIHDLGKIYVPAEILSKPGVISDIEFSIIKTHPQVGHDILRKIEFPWPLSKIVHQHHERLDGSGYPLGLKKDEILLSSRILSVADTVEAMASHRPYRPSLGIDKALEEINTNAGRFYDPHIVQICTDLFMKKGFSFDY